MTTLLSSAYLAPIDYYTQLHQSDHCLIEVHDHYQKQSYRNRCIIAATDGPLPLTIPIVKPDRADMEMKDVRISDHGNWRHLHWNALVSAYQRSPFFEYYADDIVSFYERRWEFLVDFNDDFQRTICSILDIEPRWSRTETYMKSYDDSLLDLRDRIHPRLDSMSEPHPYYQVFKDRLGFLPNLSIVDLLFNMGPEGILYL